MYTAAEQLLRPISNSRCHYVDGMLPFVLEAFIKAPAGIWTQVPEAEVKCSYPTSAEMFSVTSRK